MVSTTLLDIAMNHSDKIIRDAQLGNKDAFNKLVSLWYKRIYNFAFKYFNDHDSATEAAQRTFISLYQNIAKLQDVEKFKPWLYKIALNFCRDEERRNSNRSKLIVVREDQVDDMVTRIPDNDNPTPDKLYMQREISDLVVKSIERLNEEQKEVLIMKEYEGLKFREIAEIIGISENTVKSRLYYGFANLKKIIEKERIFKESMSYE